MEIASNNPDQTILSSLTRNCTVCFGTLIPVLLYSVVVVLLFYVHGKHLWSCRDGQLT